MLFYQEVLLSKSIQVYARRCAKMIGQSIKLGGFHCFSCHVNQSWLLFSISHHHMDLLLSVPGLFINNWHPAN
jgi:hypothetical protein